jgi:hypothetical protein
VPTWRRVINGVELVLYATVYLASGLLAGDGGGGGDDPLATPVWAGRPVGTGGGQ